MPVENDLGVRYSSSGDILSHYNDRYIVAVPLTASAVDTLAYIATRRVRVTAIKEAHSVVGSSGAAVVVKKCTGTTAPASGTAVHTGSMDLTATINTVVSPTLATNIATLTLNEGDRLALDFSGTLTNLVGVLVIEVQPV